MSRHGVVDLSAVEFSQLIGRKFKDGFQERAEDHPNSGVYRLEHGEPLVLVSCRYSPGAELFQLESDRIPVYASRLRASCWINHRGSPNPEAPIVEWSGPVGRVTATDEGRSGSTLEAHSMRDVCSSKTKVGELSHGDTVLLEDRRVRVWVPRLECLVWVWQRTTDGQEMIKWCDTMGSSVDFDAIVSVPLEVKAKGTLLSKSTVVPGGSYVLRVAGESGSLRNMLRTRDASRTAEVRIPQLPGFEDMRKVSVDAAVLRELPTPFAAMVSCKEHMIPISILDLVNAALQRLGQGDEVFKPEHMRRDQVWYDLIDPELCLCKNLKVGSSNLFEEDLWSWQASDMDVDKDGRCKWASWVNHLDWRHKDVTEALARLFEVALPQLEEIAGQRLRERRLQVVVRAYEQRMSPQQAGAPYRISEWHTDGRLEEFIVATAACYVLREPGIWGGGLDFAPLLHVHNDDPQGLFNTVPQQSAIVAFNNQVLRHRVNALRGEGRRRMVAFHVVDPQYMQRPRACDLPRPLREQSFVDIIVALAAAGKSHQTWRLPDPVIRKVAAFAASNCTMEAAITRRAAERRRRLSRATIPRLVRATTGIFPRMLRTATGILRVGDDDDFLGLNESTGSSPWTEGSDPEGFLVAD
mmetsp:Transcript_5301/g.11518  ORF Transcript_5301/g.11518 Transcript_5301/m.11518 type:complete len:638 (-) Transcript_5301:313-2226(-)